MNKRFADREINEKIYRVAGLKVSENLANKSQKVVNEMLENFTKEEESSDSPEEVSKTLKKKT